jgi:hypothetical protein
MKNIHVLPTEKPSRLFKFANQLHLDTIPKDYYKKYNIYITSDEDIKDEDYCVHTNQNSIIKICEGEGKLMKGHLYLKKIILTTDQDLIADGVQAIDDEFLEWFVKNTSCEGVETKISRYKHYYKTGEIMTSSSPTPDFSSRNMQCEKVHPFYQIIIPKEESKQETLTYTEAAKKEERIFNSTMTSKQETLEEAAENFANSKKWINGGASNWVQFSFKKGAKWQSERGYSEEEVLQMYKDYEAYVIKTPITEVIEFSKWFEQFKKK